MFKILLKSQNVKISKKLFKKCENLKNMNKTCKFSTKKKKIDTHFFHIERNIIGRDFDDKSF